MDFSAYYKRELTQLRELGAKFAESHPTLAGALRERGNDPDVERLLQGLSFLTAMIHARLDSGTPTLLQSLASLLAPDCLRSLPAATIVEFAPNLAALRVPQTLSAGKMLTSRSVEGTACRFRTCFDVELLPLELVRVHLDERAATSPALRLRLRANDAGRDSLLSPRTLRLFLHHSIPAVPATLILWFLRYCDTIQLQSLDGRLRTSLRPENLRISGLDPNYSIYPTSPGAPWGFQLLVEYFSLPEKFYFLDVSPFELPQEFPAEFELVFRFRAPPPLPAPFGAETVRLFCTPAINLFDAVAEPLLHTQVEGEHLLRADGVAPQHMEVFSVQSVVGVGSHGGRRDFCSFFRFEHLGAMERPAFALRREQSVLDDGFDTFITLIEPRSQGEPASEESISAALTCTNRNLPNQLHVGDVEDPAPGPLLRRCTNITTITPPVRQPFRAEDQWRMVAHMAIHQRGLVSAENLRLLLRLYNLPGLLQTQVGRGNLRRIEAIREVTRRAGMSLIEGVPVRAVHTDIVVDEAGFSGGLGEIFLFGAILNELYGTTSPINLASEFSLYPIPSSQRMRWETHLGC